MSAETERLADLLDAWLEGDPVAAPPGELSDLLAAAAQVRLLTDVPLPPSGLNRGRAAFIAAGVSQAEESTRAGFLSGLFATFGRYRMAPLTMMVALLLLSGVVTTARAQSSLPGDLLYPVKRLTESVQVVITRGTDRDAMRAELQQRRRDETQSLLERHRAAPVAFEGQAALGADGLWRVGGVVVQFGDVLPEGLAAGAVVSVTGVTDPDGVVQVSALRVMTPAVDPATPPVAVAQASPEVAVAIIVDEPTPTSRPASPTPMPIVATSIPLPTAEPPTAMPTGVPTAVVPEAPVREKQYVEWDGVLEHSVGEWWTVAGQDFYRPSGRVRGEVAQCVIVHVRAQLKKDGKRYLDDLNVTAPRAKPSREDVKGTITEVGKDFVDIDHNRIVLPTDVQKDGELVVGRFARVILRVDCGRRIAEHIEVDGPQEQHFTGFVMYVDDSTLVVNDTRLQRNKAAEIGNVQVGAFVEVIAVAGDDGVWIAKKVRVMNDAPPTQTATTVPSATATTEPPTPSPSETPTLAATAEPTAASVEP